MKIVRGFDLDCVFLMSEILDKMELGFDADKIIQGTKQNELKNKKDAAALGKEVVVGLGLDIGTKMIRKLYKAKEEVKELIMNLTGMSKEEVSKLGIKEMKEFFVLLVNHEGFGDFLAQAGE